MLVFRDAVGADLQGLLRLAEVLNSINLPFDESVLRERLKVSVASFTGKIASPWEREYLFVLEDTAQKDVVGTSLVVAQHGTKEAPHVYFDVTETESYSRTLDRHFRHTILSLGYNYSGPTEIGGLVVSPRARNSEAKPGKQLSYGRFLYMAMFREHFRDQVIAELLPPLMPDGRSLLWEALGKRFTGLDYKTADALSRKNKEFIKELFPAAHFYTALFPPRVQRAIGEVGKGARPARRMLERIGFRWIRHIDPFDGGPHFQADFDSIRLVTEFRRCRLSPKPLVGETPRFLVAAAHTTGRSRFRAVATEARFDGEEILLPKEARSALAVRAGTQLGVIPFDVES